MSFGVQCAPAHKLYALYLVDSIVKNIGVPYTTLFAGAMPQVWRIYSATLLSHPHEAARMTLTR